jgi:hypothetical protein
VEKQSELLLKVYLAERAKDPSSQATKSSRSNVIALPHTIRKCTENPRSADSRNPHSPFRNLKARLKSQPSARVLGNTLFATGQN